MPGRSPSPLAIAVALVVTLTTALATVLGRLDAARPYAPVASAGPAGSAGPAALPSATPPPGPGTRIPPPARLPAPPSAPPTGGPLGSPPPLPGPEYAVAPYAHARHLLAGKPNLSVYSQPWRGWVETRPAADLAAGVGLNYNLPADAAHDAVVGLLAGVGVRHLRREVPFSAVDYDTGRLRAGEQASLVAFLRACAEHGVRPLLLLNGNSGAPTPYRTSTRRLVAAAPRGARVVVLDDVSGLVAGRSGLSFLTGNRMAEVLFTRVDPATRTAELSRPLPVALPAGERRVDTLRYPPLRPVGSAAFADSAAGWVRYAALVADTARAHVPAGFDVEIWNELSFGSEWLRADAYHDPPVAAGAPDTLRPGGAAWELARRTADAVKARAPGARVVWGFSNTTFHHTPPALLPPRTDGQSYHPYGTGLETYPAGLPTGNGAVWEHGHVPALRKLMPEGWAHLGTRHEQLPRALLSPAARRARPPGTARFLHLLTEHGVAPREAGVTTELEAQELKALVAVRSLGFWLNKGVDVVDLYSAYDPDPLGMGMLRSDLAPRDYAGVPREQLLTPQLRAIEAFTAPLRGATAGLRPAQVTVAASSFGPQAEVFPAGPGHPALPYREMLAVLPFQATASRFLVGAYVMSWDVSRPPPPQSFRLRLGGLPARTVRASLVDASTGVATRLPAYRQGKDLVVDLVLTDRPAWLVLDA